MIKTSRTCNFYLSVFAISKNESFWCLFPDLSFRNFCVRNRVKERDWCASVYLCVTVGGISEVDRSPDIVTGTLSIMERIGSYIPNESPAATTPKPEAVSASRVRRNSDGESASSIKGGNRSGKKLTRSVSTPQSERRSEGGSSSHGDDGGGSNSKNKTWRVIMANISRSVDELYYLCEDERDEVKCREIISFMERAGYDFDKLIDRIGEQQKFESSQTSGVSWEVRKPTSTTYLAEVSTTINLI